MKPILRGHFHQAMFFIGIGAFVPLILKCKTSSERISILIYGICALTMFGISAIYHRVNWMPHHRQLWKKIDHAGIYLMIAGSCTPIAILGLQGDSGTKILITFWVVAIVGILQSIFFVNMPKIVSSVFYLIAGLLVLPYIPEIKESIGMGNIWLIVFGGIAYTAGALCYSFKFPKINPKVFGYHEVFHLLVNLGAIFHFIVVSSLVK